MAVSPWLPFLIGFGLTILGTCLGPFVPFVSQKKQTEVEEPLLNPLSTNDQVTVPGSRKTLKQRILEASAEMKRLTTLDTNFLLILVAFVVGYLGRSAVGLILQYASKRYYWTIAEATYLISLRGAVTLLLLLVLLPGISALLASKTSMGVQLRDKRLAQVSLALKFFGFIVIFLAFRPALIVLGLVLFALGSGFAVPARNLATELADEQSLGLVYTAMAVATSVGMMIAGPLLAYTFRLGMQLGEFWMGLPFLVAGLLYIIAFVSISLTRLRE